MRAVLFAVLAFGLAGCQLVYKLPTRQGNVIEQKQLDKLAVGMTREQVKFLLGTPIATSAFRDDRWDYTGYYKNPRGKVYNRTVSLYFDGDALARMEGLQQEASANGTVLPDLEALEQQEKKDKTEAERAKEDTGIVITPPRTEP